MLFRMNDMLLANVRLLFGLIVFFPSIFLPKCFAQPALPAAAPIEFAFKKINFQLENGVTPAKNIPETMLGGVAIFDYNGDGRSLYWSVSSAIRGQSQSSTG